MSERPRDKIIEVLKLEPFLTIPQVAALFYSVRRDGQLAKSTRFRPRPKDTYELVPGYHSARAILNRMVDSKQLVVYQNRGDDTTPSLPNLYALKGTRKPINDRHLFGHDMDVVDCFVALRRAFGGRLERWERRWDKEQRAYFGDKWKLWPDAVFELADNETVYFLEVDRGSEEADQIEDKLARYVAFSKAHPMRTQSSTVVVDMPRFRTLQ